MQYVNERVKIKREDDESELEKMNDLEITKKQHEASCRRIRRGRRKNSENGVKITFFPHKIDRMPIRLSQHTDTHTCVYIAENQCTFCM